MHLLGSLSNEFLASLVTDSGDEGLEVLGISSGSTVLEELGDIIGGYYKMSRLGLDNNKSSGLSLSLQISPLRMQES